jgi:transposase
MSKKQPRRFTPEQKADAVEMVRRLGSVPQVARELGLVQSVLYKWVQQAGLDPKEGPQGPLTAAERQELQRLQREVAMLRMERDFLKKAAAFFAKDGDRPSR